MNISAFIDYLADITNSRARGRTLEFPTAVSSSIYLDNLRAIPFKPRQRIISVPTPVGMVKALVEVMFPNKWLIRKVMRMGG